DARFPPARRASGGNHYPSLARRAGCVRTALASLTNLDACRLTRQSAPSSRGIPREWTASPVGRAGRRRLPSRVCHPEEELARASAMLALRTCSPAPSGVRGVYAHIKPAIGLP